MKPPPEHERLLSDVLAEGTPVDFAATVLGQTLRLARRRRRTRQLRFAATAVAAAWLFGMLLWRGAPEHPAVVRTSPANHVTVRTRPLPASAVVTSQRFTIEPLLASTAHVTIVRTTPRGSRYRIVNDDELLAFVAPRPAALVRLGPDHQELIFAHPADADGFLMP